MDSDLLNTDGPMTRGRRRAMYSTGLTPVAAGDLGGATPNLLNDTPMARELFTDKTNVLDQARPFPGQSKNVSPTNGWVGKSDRGDMFSVQFDVDQEPPVTPNLFVNAKKADIQHATPASSACVHGPTPANTPAAGCVAQMPEPSLLSQAVNELQGEDCENRDGNFMKTSGVGTIGEQYSEKHVFDAGNNEFQEVKEENAEGTDECLSEDVDPEINEILRELDEYVLNSQNEDQSVAERVDTMETEDALVDNVAAEEEMDNVVLTPAVFGMDAVLSEDPSSVMAEPPSASQILSGHDHSIDEGLCQDAVLQQMCGAVMRDDETRHTSVKELPVSAGPYNPAQDPNDDSSDDAVQQGSPAPALDLAAGVPTIAIDGEQSPVQLQAAGREDDLPTPGFFQPGARPVGSPATPEDVAIKPLAFAKSAGSQFATPEIPISCGMTPMTTMVERQAQKHIPAWNRISTVVEKQYPLVSKIVQGLWHAPSEQPAWSKTPFMLLHAICVAKGWGLTVSPETESRIGAGSSIVATVNMPSPTVEGGLTFTATGKNMGHLEALLLAAAGVLEKLLKEHLITGKDATAAMNTTPGTLKPGSVPSVVGSTLHFGQAVHASTFAAARSKFACASQHVPSQSRPPVPVAPRSICASMPVPCVEMSTPVESSPHGGIGVRAPPQNGATPELVPVPSPAGSLAASAKIQSKPVTPVYHPPMRTGTSSVRSKNKATIAAAAKPTGLKALQEQQKQLVKNMKRESEIMAELTKSVGKISIASKGSTPLRGVPIPKGSCIVFDDDGQACEVKKRDQLRGVPLARGTHTHF